MSLIRINKNPTGRQLLVFGTAWFVALGALGWASYSRGRPHVAEAAWSLSLCVPIIGIAYPRSLRWIYLGLSYATFPIGFVVSHAVLALLYFLVLTPVGMTMRVFRYDPLARKFDPKARTYWAPRDKQRPPESYFNQS